MSPTKKEVLNPDEFIFVKTYGILSDSHRMQLAYEETVKRVGDSCVHWVKPKEAKDKASRRRDFKNNTFFVMEDFRGDLFEYLETQLYLDDAIWVIGPQVLLYMSRFKIPKFLHYNWAIQNLSMRSVTVSATGVDEAEENECSTEVQRNGGFYVKGSTTSGVYITGFAKTSTHLLIGSASSPDPEVIKEAERLKLIIMKIGWVKDISQEARAGKFVRADDPEFAVHKYKQNETLEESKRPYSSSPIDGTGSRDMDISLSIIPSLNDSGQINTIPTFPDVFQDLAPGKARTLKDVVDVLRLVTPEWNNLEAPCAPDMIVKKILLGDLTSSNGDKAMRMNAEMIISYYQPALTGEIAITNFKEFSAMCKTANITALCLPPTAKDCVLGGVDESYVKILAEIGKIRSVSSIKSIYDQDIKRIVFQGDPNSLHHVLMKYAELLKDNVLMAKFDVDTVCLRAGEVGSMDGVGAVSLYSAAEVYLSGIADDVSYSPSEWAALRLKFLSTEQCDRLFNCKKRLDWKRPGTGKFVILETGISVTAIIEAIQQELNLNYVQNFPLNIGNLKAKSIAICTSGGGALFSEVASVDCYITDEASRQNILDFLSRPNKSVVLLGHFDAERHFNEKLAKIFNIMFQGNVEFIISDHGISPVKRN